MHRNSNGMHWRDERERQANSHGMLNIIIAHYLRSGNFNGYYVSSETCTRDMVATIKSLVQDGKIDIIFSDDQVRPEIKAFPPKDRDIQLKRLEEEQWSGFAYPTPSVLVSRVNPLSYKNRPYSLELALGKPQLDCKIFNERVLHVYEESHVFGVWKNHNGGYIYEVGQNGALKEVLCMFSFVVGSNNRRYLSVFLMYLHHMPPQHQNLWREMEEEVQLKAGYRIDVPG